jgi:FtsH-binding integral membrane protein
MRRRVRGWVRLRPWKRHSLVLLVLGIIYMLIGLSYAVQQPSSYTAHVTIAATLIMPIRAWGWVWIGAGLLSVLSSRWPPASETWGYTALSFLAALWACFYFWGLLFLGGGSIPGALAWSAIAFLWWAISGLHNPPEQPDREEA